MGFVLHVRSKTQFGMWRCVFSRCGYCSKTGRKDTMHLRELLSDALKDQMQTKVTPFRLEECAFRRSFSETCISLDKYCVDDDGVYRQHYYLGKTSTPLINFQSIFREGFSLLTKFIEKGFLVLDTTNSGFRSALFRLLEFLESKEYHESSIRSQKREYGRSDRLELSESYTAVLLTNHLLSQLIPGNDFIISDHYPNKPIICPCFNNCDKVINYENTSLGSENLWYGHSDVLLTASSNLVMVNSNTTFLDEAEVINNLSFKEEASSDLELCGPRIEYCLDEIISQAITFSLYQSKRTRHYTLIPSIVVTPSRFYIYMYDHFHDVLLSNWPTGAKLWSNDWELSLPAILQLWMTLNHMIFTPRLQEQHLKWTRKSANFHAVCDAEGLSISEISEGIMCRCDFRLESSLNMKRINRDLVIA